jgi:hypothetical protein
MAILDLLASLAELAWLYIQLYGLRTARWVYANPDQATGAALGLLGAFLLARGGPRAGLGWLAFLGSNAALIAMAWRLDLPGVLLLQLGFTYTSLYGIWTHLIQPLRSAAQAASWAKLRPAATQAPKTHDYPACATFRGGRCTCD